MNKFSEYLSVKIGIIAWRSFPVTAKVKCKGEDEFQTYTTWITVD